MPDPLAALAAEPESWTVRVPDRLALRTLAPPSPDLTARTVAVLLEAGPGCLLRPRPGWPPLVRMRARRLPEHGWLVVARFAKPAPVAEVLAELGRGSVWRDRTGNEGLWVEGEQPAQDVVPPDVRRSADVDGAATPGGDGEPAGEPNPFTRRPVVTLPAATVEPIDERVINPAGFRPADGPLVRVPADAELGEALVASLRAAAGAEVTAAPVRVVAGLAMAGVPLVRSAAEPPDAETMAALGADLVALLTRPVDLADPLAREEHSIELRRLALDRFGLRSWRRRVAGALGVRMPDAATVSVVLATKRADMLDFAVRQVARQRGAQVELVLAPHGFEADVARVRAAFGDRPLTVVPQPESTLFGDVLDAAAERASGEVVLKMDDDDWYSPDVVADLLRARAYSGAEVVGMPAEFHYLTERDLTVRRGHTAEHQARFVAGGTMMIERALLREVGGFRPVRRYVDAQLLAAVAAAGGGVYRTHGLGYVLRRNPSGHTWQVDLDYLLDPGRTAQTWEGFRVSRLMEIDPADLP